MKILHVLDTSVPDTAGYTTRGYYLAIHQKKMGYHPVVLTSERYKGAGNKECEIIDGISYYRSDSTRRRVIRIPFLAELDEIRVLRQRIAEVAVAENVAVVHAHSPSLIGAAAAHWCRENHIPLVYEIRAFWEDAAVDRGAFAENSIKYRLRRLHETGVVRRADAVVAICNGIKDDLVARNIEADKIVTIRNGVDCDLFQPGEESPGLKKQLGLEGKTIVGFIGSFFHFEGIQDLLQAMQSIGKERKDIALLLVGSGQNYTEVKQLSHELNLGDIVTLTGRVPHSEVKDYYSIMDLMVYPRIRKRITELVTPLKPLEAMAMGKTVLLSDVGGLVELVDDRDAVAIYPAGDITALAAQIVSLCDDPERRRKMGEVARKSMESNWNWADRAAQGVQLYLRLLESYHH